MRGKVIKSVWDRLLLNITAFRKSQLFEADPMIHQEQLLRRLLESCQNTMFGNMHDFSSIRSNQQFLTHVPLMSYSNLKPCIDKILEGKNDILFPGRPICFGVTTGTEGDPKLIPLNRALLEVQDWRLLMLHYLGAYTTDRYYGTEEKHCTSGRERNNSLGSG